ncbi:hypothetical protein C0995_008994 [Termitomyces sp. Mi166|nr:hypothetical protein C0995_008994 [Termitomyces sp. Mi166\
MSFKSRYANGVIGSVNTLLKRIYGPDLLSRHNYSTVLSSLAFAGIVVGMLIFGIGVGAEYPCGSVSASEQTEQPGISKRAQHRWFVLATNTMIDFGFGDNHLRAVWRLSLGLGVVPAFLVFLWRLNMEEPERYRKESMRRTRIPYGLVLRRYGVRLAAISTSCLTNNSDSLSVVFGWNVVINLFYIPGTLIGASVVDYLGPKWTMVVYGIFLSFGEFGPGNCLGLLASKSSPTAIRGQFYGIAAAVGKIGAFVGTWAFGGPNSVKGNTGLFWVGSGLAILSALVTLFFVHPLTTDGMEKEDREVGSGLRFREYLEANGYDTSRMGLGEDTIVDEKTLDKKVPVDVDLKVV